MSIHDLAGFMGQVERSMEAGGGWTYPRPTCCWYQGRFPGGKSTTFISRLEFSPGKVTGIMFSTGRQEDNSLRRLSSIGRVSAAF